MIYYFAQILDLQTMELVFDNAFNDNEREALQFFIKITDVLELNQWQEHYLGLNNNIRFVIARGEINKRYTGTLFQIPV